ncbi:MAG: hypothetical protein D6736_08155 [Nitrospinota bacterium]|nr:MAG: hypothetical protein D6736_08155 [Nitrospinota bacterium]
MQPRISSWRRYLTEAHKPQGSGKGAAALRPYPVLITRYSLLITRYSSLITHYSLLITHYSVSRCLEQLTGSRTGIILVLNREQRSYQRRQDAYNECHDPERTGHHPGTHSTRPEFAGRG